MKESVLNIQNLNFYYGEKQALYNINIEVAPKQVTAFIGPSGCGKSTLLRCINRMNDLIDNTKTEGAIKFLGENIYDEETDVIELRRKVGMVFQKSNPIFENVVYGLRIAGITDKKKLKEAAEISLQRAALWDEVKDNFTTPESGATSPAARAIAKIKPVIIPGKAIGIETRKRVCDLVEPSAKEPSFIPLGTAFKASSVATITTGKVSIERVKLAHRIPPVPKVGFGNFVEKKS